MSDPTIASELRRLAEEYAHASQIDGPRYAEARSTLAQFAWRHAEELAAAWEIANYYSGLRPTHTPESPVGRFLAAKARRERK